MDDDDSVEYAFRSFFPLKPCLPLYISPSIQRRRFTLVERAFCELCRVRISRWMDEANGGQRGARPAEDEPIYYVPFVRIYTQHTHIHLSLEEISYVTKIRGRKNWSRAAIHFCLTSESYTFTYLPACYLTHVLDGEPLSVTNRVLL